MVFGPGGRAWGCLTSVMIVKEDGLLDMVEIDPKQNLRASI